MFYKSDVNRARQQLDAQYNEIRKKDSNLISFFGGATIMCILFLLFSCITETDESKMNDNWLIIASGIDIYYFTSILVFILFATGFSVQVFRMFNINYTFIFEVD
jgi:hypothetical protein